MRRIKTHSNFFDKSVVCRKGKYMKNTATIIVLSLGIIVSSCDKEEVSNGANFYNTEYRKGLWVNADKTDTLQFVDGVRLIRYGNYYSYEEYLYRLENDILYIRLPSDPEFETQHVIMTVEGNRLTLGNMYITFGFANSSGTFYKEFQ